MRLRTIAASFVLLPAALSLLAPMARAATVTGTVRNGTSGKPAAGVDVILIQLAGDMKPVANTKTAADGNYSIENPAAGRDGMPMLIRAVYRGVNFHQPLPPGQLTADVTVYEPTADPKTVKFNTRVVMFQPNGENLMVVEEYALQNSSQPPVAFYNANGNFDFSLPDGAENPAGLVLGAVPHAGQSGNDQQGEREVRHRLCLSARRQRRACQLPGALRVKQNHA